MPRLVNGPVPYSLSTDPSPYDLPLEKWSDTLDVRFHDKEARSTGGVEKVFAGASDAPLFVLPWTNPPEVYWLYGTETAIWQFSSAGHQDVSRPGGYGPLPTAVTISTGPHGLGQPDVWGGFQFSGIAIMNQRIDVPQFLTQTGTQFADLTNWPVGQRCSVLRPFKQFLIAANIERSGTGFPFLVHWSEQADPGQLPPNWDVADPASRSGEINLGEHDGPIVDALGLRDQMLIYRRSSVYALSFVGGPFVFRSRVLFEDRGVLCQHAVAEFENRHFVVGIEDFYTTDGNTYQLVGEGDVSEGFFRDVDPLNWWKTHVVTQQNEDEIWVCYPETGSTECNRALVWNWNENTWSKRTLYNVRHSAFGLVDENYDNTYAVQTDTYAEAVGRRYSDVLAGLGALTVLHARQATIDFLAADRGQNGPDGEPIVSRMERTGLNLGTPDQVLQIERIVPRVRGGPVRISIGSEFAAGEGVFWGPAMTFTPGQDEWLKFKTTGRYFGLRVESAMPGEGWSMSGLAIDGHPKGPR